MTEGQCDWARAAVTELFSTKQRKLQSLSIPECDALESAAFAYAYARQAVLSGITPACTAQQSESALLGHLNVENSVNLASRLLNSYCLRAQDTPMLPIHLFEQGVTPEAIIQIVSVCEPSIVALTQSEMFSE